MAMDRKLSWASLVTDRLPLALTIAPLPRRAMASLLLTAIDTAAAMLTWFASAPNPWLAFSLTLLTLPTNTPTPSPSGLSGVELRPTVLEKVLFDSFSDRALTVVSP